MQNNECCSRIRKNRNLGPGPDKLGSEKTFRKLSPVAGQTVFLPSLPRSLQNFKHKAWRLWRAGQWYIIESVLKHIATAQCTLGLNNLHLFLERYFWRPAKPKLKEKLRKCARKNDKLFAFWSFEPGILGKWLEPGPLTLLYQPYLKTTMFNRTVKTSKSIKHSAH